MKNRAERISEATLAYPNTTGRSKKSESKSSFCLGKMGHGTLSFKAQLKIDQTGSFCSFIVKLMRRPAVATSDNVPRCSIRISLTNIRADSQVQNDCTVAGNDVFLLEGNVVSHHLPQKHSRTSRKMAGEQLSSTLEMVLEE